MKIKVLILLMALSGYNGFCQETFTGILRHTNSYLTISPYNGSYDDGSYARLFYDGNNKRLEFWNSDSGTTYTNLNTGNVMSNGNLSATGNIIAGGNMTATGSMGIGTTSPQSKLHITNGGQAIRFATGSNSSGYMLDIGVNDDGINFTANSTHRGFNFSNFNGTLLTLSRNGNLGIGTTTPDSKLTVKGTIHTEEVRVDLSVPAPDYVFREGYELLSLEETQKYINEHGHLPNIPSAKEMEAEGVELGIMNMKLLEKIEELTLYLLDQENKIKNLEKEKMGFQEMMDELVLVKMEIEKLKSN
jgi:hypothetical protein